ncbi:MAG: nucleotidyltransferase domain-containing protein [Cyanobacteria bacterium P01_A01_bin.123]
MVDEKDIELVHAQLNLYVEKLSHSIQVTAAYLFGSYARGNATQDSDIDILVLSPDFSDDPTNNLMLLMKARRGIDLRIEPHPIRPKDFNNTHPFIKEIMPDLIPIPLQASQSHQQKPGFSSQCLMG